MNDFQVIVFVGTLPETFQQELLAEFSDESMITPIVQETMGKDFTDLQPILSETLPDLICVFADELETQNENVAGFCRFLRETHHAYHRPVIIVVSAAPEDRRITYLVEGADDILDAGLSSEELKVRLLVHLRRSLDFTASEITQLPSLPLATKVTHRRLKRGEALALMVIELTGFEVYSELYGELPARQVLKTFAALLGQLVLLPDLICHSDENHFVLVTQPEKAEKLAALFCRQFDTVSPNFYSDKDRKQGYMVSILADNISRRVPLMTLSIGIVSSETQPAETFLPLFNAAQQTKDLARMTSGSNWVSDRRRLSGSGAVETIQAKPGILVLESDAALAYLLKATLEMEGYPVEVASDPMDALALLTADETQARFELLILDALLHDTETGLSLMRDLRTTQPNLKMICASSLHDRQRVLQAGADLYLPKPFELSGLFSWIHRLLRENG